LLRGEGEVMVLRGKAWHGEARQGMARRGKDEKMEITSKMNNQKMKGGYTR